MHDVIAHLVGVNAFWEASVRAGLSGAPTQALATFDPAAHPPLMVAPMRALSPQELLEQFVATNDGILGALAEIDDDGWNAIAETPVGHVSIRLLAFHALWDAWIHEHDVAIPLGLPAVEHADELASCLRYAASVGPTLALDWPDRIVGTFAVVAHDPPIEFTVEVGAAVAVRDVAPASAPTTASAPCLRGRAVELIEALSIRAPLAADAPAEWAQLLGSLATVFDQAPGGAAADDAGQARAMTSSP